MGRRVPIERRVAERVRELRERQGMSAAELARRAGTSRSQVASVERGDSAPTIATLEVFARALGVDLAAFVTSVDQTKREQGAPDRADRLARNLRERGPGYVDAVERFLALTDRLYQRRSDKGES